MSNKRNFRRGLIACAMLILFSLTILAQDPGTPINDKAAEPGSDQKPGSVLIYNYYSSDAADATAEDTQINLTNTNATTFATVHLFFVDGQSCSTGDTFVCLTPNQTMRFNASDIDPGTRGYIVAIATNRSTGCPENFNYLIGSESLYLATGHTATLAAESIAAWKRSACSGAEAVLNFDGKQYDQVPRALALDSIGSSEDGYDTLLIVNRIGGNLATGATPIGNVFGVLYDAAENAYSWTRTNERCQMSRTLNNSFPRTFPRFGQVIPAGLTGWMKFWATSDAGLVGAAVTYNAGRYATPRQHVYVGGKNLHHLTLTSASLTVPVFPPECP